ncbi:Vacuolar inheritance and morphology protein [Mucor velutinosus]|uniref:Vacuolar inheritance and morphology protein n=1 Tax=Mucor velutinosus TaxID=708070 RepID=A0AAN7D744_9FUNG|nr:Vacuolar inheritance and morphology protein [Mucor velutinosus]
MKFDPITVSRDIVMNCITAFQYLLLFLLPFSELIRRMRAQGIENFKLAARLESFERNVTALLSNRINNNSQDKNGANNTKTDPSTSDTNTDISNASIDNSNARTSVITCNSNIPSTSSKAIPPQPSSVSTAPKDGTSSIKQLFSDSLTDYVKRLHMQLNETALDLSDTIGDLQEVNQTMKAEIAALKSQLEEQRSKTNKTHNLMASRLEILERYIQSGAKLEDQRKQESQQVRVLSQRNTDLINQRIDTVEEQLIISFKEFEERRNRELQSFIGNSKSLNKLCDDFKMRLNEQAQVVADHDREIAMNTETIRNTFSSKALANLGKGVRDALDMCESKLFKVEEDQKTLQAMLEETSDKFKVANDTVTSMKTKFHALNKDIRAEMADVNERLGRLSQNIFNNATQLGFEFDFQNPPRQSNQ